MNAGIFDVPRLVPRLVMRLVICLVMRSLGAAPFEVFSIASSRGFLLALSSRLECQTALEAAALPDRMNGFGRGPLPAAISAMVRPEATERSCSQPRLLSSRSYSSRCL